MTIGGKEYKNEGSYELAPGQTWEHGFDGIAAPHISTNAVFKVNNGVSATVTNEGITSYGGAIESKLGMIAGKLFTSSEKTGGWKLLLYLPMV